MIQNLTEQCRYEVVRTIHCHICDRQIFRGEKRITMWATKGYANICHNCMLEFGRIGESIREWNEEFLKLPVKERLDKFQAIQELEK